MHPVAFRRVLCVVTAVAVLKVAADQLVDVSTSDQVQPAAQ